MQPSRPAESNNMAVRAQKSNKNLNQTIPNCLKKVQFSHFLYLLTFSKFNEVQSSFPQFVHSKGSYPQMSVNPKITVIK